MLLPPGIKIVLTYLVTVLLYEAEKQILKLRVQSTHQKEEAHRTRSELQEGGQVTDPLRVSIPPLQKHVIPKPARKAPATAPTPASEPNSEHHPLRVHTDRGNPYKLCPNAGPQKKGQKG